MSKTVVTAFGTFDDDQLRTLEGGLKELSDVFTMQESQKEVVKDIVSNLKDELSIPKKMIMKLARTYHRRNFSEVVAEQEEFTALFEGITEK